MASELQHVVFWWLKEATTETQREDLMAAARALAAIPGVSRVSAGSRHAVPWPGPENTFDLGLVISFASVEALESYGPHPLHLRCVGLASAIMERSMAFFVG